MPTKEGREAREEHEACPGKLQCACPPTLIQNAMQVCMQKKACVLSVPAW